MTVSTVTVIVLAFAAFGVLPAASQTTPATSQTSSDDRTKIEALESAFSAAFNAKDVDAIMKVYVPDASLVVFDVVPPKQVKLADCAPNREQPDHGPGQ